MTQKSASADTILFFCDTRDHIVLFKMNKMVLTALKYEEKNSGWTVTVDNQGLPPRIENRGDYPRDNPDNH